MQPNCSLEWSAYSDEWFLEPNLMEVTCIWPSSSRLVGCDLPILLNMTCLLKTGWYDPPPSRLVDVTPLKTGWYDLPSRLMDVTFSLRLMGVPPSSSLLDVTPFLKTGFVFVFCICILGKWEVRLKFTELQCLLLKNRWFSDFYPIIGPSLIRCRPQYGTVHMFCIMRHMWKIHKNRLCLGIINIPAKQLHNSDTVSVHFNHLYCMGICDKLSRHLSMLTYMYLNVDECWLTSSMP